VTEEGHFESEREPGLADASQPAFSVTAWRDVFAQLDRIEARQADLRAALWEKLVARLDRIERNQAELNQMLAQLGADHGEPEPPSRPARPALASRLEMGNGAMSDVRARPDMGLPPFARALPGERSSLDPTFRAFQGFESWHTPVEERSPTTEDSPDSTESPTPAAAPDWLAGPFEPIREPTWLAFSSLPAGFGVYEPSGWRRWFPRRRSRHPGLDPDRSVEATSPRDSPPSPEVSAPPPPFVSPEAVGSVPVEPAGTDQVEQSPGARSA